MFHSKNNSHREDYIMSELSKNILMKEIPQYLQTGEELITVGSFIKRAGYLKNQLTLGYAQLGNQVFYIGITDRRVIILPTKRMTGKVDKEKAFSVQHHDVELRGNKLIIRHPKEGKSLKLNFYFGIKALSGLDKKDFLKSIYQIIKITD